MGCGASTAGETVDEVKEKVAEAAEKVKEKVRNFADGTKKAAGQVGDALVVQKDVLKQDITRLSRRAYNFVRGRPNDTPAIAAGPTAVPSAPTEEPGGAQAADETETPPAPPEQTVRPTGRLSQGQGSSQHTTGSDRWEQYAMMFPELPPVQVRIILAENPAAPDRVMYKKLEEAVRQMADKEGDSDDELLPLGDGGGEAPANFSTQDDTGSAQPAGQTAFIAHCDESDTSSDQSPDEETAAGTSTPGNLNLAFIPNATVTEGTDAHCGPTVAQPAEPARPATPQNKPDDGAAAAEAAAAAAAAEAEAAEVAAAEAAAAEVAAAEAAAAEAEAARTAAAEAAAAEAAAAAAAAAETDAAEVAAAEAAAEAAAAEAAAAAAAAAEAEAAEVAAAEAAAAEVAAAEAAAAEAAAAAAAAAEAEAAEVAAAEEAAAKAEAAAAEAAAADLEGGAKDAHRQFYKKEMAAQFAAWEAERNHEQNRLFCWDVLEDDDVCTGIEDLTECKGLFSGKHVSGLFGDAFIMNTEIEGGGVCLSAFMETFEIILAKHAVGKSPFLSKRLFRNAEKEFTTPLQSVIKVMENACYPTSVEQVRKCIEALNAADPVLWLPTGWPFPSPGHAVHWVIVWTAKDTYDVVYIDSNGVASCDEGFPKKRNYGRVAVRGVEKKRLCSTAFLMAFTRIGGNEPAHTEAYMTDVLFPLMLGKAVQFLPPQYHDTPAAFGAEELGVVKSPQKAGTCYIKGTLQTLHYLLGGYGMGAKQQKALFVLLRLTTLEQTTSELAGFQQQLGARYCITVSQYKMLEIVQHQVVNAAQKAYYDWPADGGLIDSAAFVVVSNAIAAFKKALPAKILDAVRVTQPRALAIEDKASALAALNEESVVAHNGYDLVYSAYASDANMAAFAGPARPAKKPIKPFCLGPALVRPGASCEEVMRALTVLTTGMQQFCENTSGVPHPLGHSLRKSLFEYIIFEVAGPPPQLKKGKLDAGHANGYWKSVLAAGVQTRVDCFWVWTMVARAYARIWARGYPFDAAMFGRRVVGQFSIFTIVDGFIRAGVGPTSDVLRKFCINPLSLHNLGDFFQTMQAKDLSVASARAGVLAYLDALPKQRLCLHYLEDATPNNDYWTQWSSDGKVVDDGVGQSFMSKCGVKDKDLGELQCEKADYINMRVLYKNAPEVGQDGRVSNPLPTFLWPGYRDVAFLCRFALFPKKTSAEASENLQFSYTVDKPEPSGKMNVMCFHGYVVRTWTPHPGFKQLPAHSVIRRFHEDARMETEVVANSVNTAWFPDVLSREDSEVLTSLLAKPSLRIPLTVEYLLQLSNLSVPREVEDALLAMCVEPGRWAPTMETYGGGDGKCNVPLLINNEPMGYSTPVGLLRQEWLSNAETMVGVLQQLVARVVMEEEAAGPYDGPVQSFLFAIRLLSTLRRFGNCAKRTAYDTLDAGLEKIGALLELRINKAHDAVFTPVVGMPADEQSAEIFRRLQHVTSLLLHRAMLYSALPESPHHPLCVMTAVIALTRIGVPDDMRLEGAEILSVLPMVTEDQYYANEKLGALPGPELNSLMNKVVDLVCGPGTSDAFKAADWSVSKNVATCGTWEICLVRGLLTSPQADVPTMLPADVVRHPNFNHLFGTGAALVANVVFECPRVTRFSTKYMGMDFELDFWKKVGVEGKEESTPEEDEAAIDAFFSDAGGQVVKHSDGSVTVGSSQFDVAVCEDTVPAAYPEDVKSFLGNLLGDVLCGGFAFHGAKGEMKQGLPYYRFASVHSNSGCVVELWVVVAFARPCAHLFLLCEEGRRLFRKLIWTSHHDYALATMVPDYISKRGAKECSFALRHAAGVNLKKMKGAELFSEDSLVIRAYCPTDRAIAYELLPPEVLYGVLPEGVLECKPDPTVEPPIDDPQGLIAPVALLRRLWIARAAQSVWRPDGKKREGGADHVELLGFSTAALSAGQASRESSVIIDVKPSGTANIRYGKRTLLDTAYAKNPHVRGAVQVLARLDSLSHVLQWLPDGASTPEFELPRVQLEFGYASVATMDGVNEIRLMSKSHNRLFVSNQRGPHLWANLYGLPHGVLLESEAGALSVLMPSCVPQRQQVEGAPLHVNVILDRLSVAEIPEGSPRTYLVAVHVSCERLTPETVESALYVMNMRLMHRAYASAASLASVCHVDHPLSVGERRVLRMFYTPMSKTKDFRYDGHPDHLAVLLRLVLALGFCTEVIQGVEKPLCYQWSVPQVLDKMTTVLRHVSVNCRLTPQEMEQLLDTTVALTDEGSVPDETTPKERLGDSFGKVGEWLRQVVDAKEKGRNNGFVEMQGKQEADPPRTVLCLPVDALEAWITSRRNTFDDLIDGRSGAGAWCGMSRLRYERPKLETQQDVDTAWRRFYKDNMEGGEEGMGFLFVYEALAGHLGFAEKGFEPKGLPEGSLLGRAMLGGMCVRKQKGIDPDTEDVLQLLKCVAALPAAERALLPKVPACDLSDGQHPVIRWDPEQEATELRPFFEELLSLLEKNVDVLRKDQCAAPSHPLMTFTYKTRLPFRYFRVEQSNTAHPAIEMRQLYLGDPSSVYVHFPHMEARAMATTPLAATVNALLKSGPRKSGGGKGGGGGGDAPPAPPLHAAAFTSNLAKPESAEARGVQRLLDCSVAKVEAGEKSPLDVALRRAKGMFTLQSVDDIPDVYECFDGLRQTLLHQQQLDRRGAFAARLWATELASYPSAATTTKAQQHEALLHRVMLVVGHAPRSSLAELSQVAMSTTATDDLCRGNPFLEAAASTSVVHASTVALLRFCRVEQIGRCLLQLADALRTMVEAQETKRLDEANAAISALLAQLFATRQYVKLRGSNTGSHEEGIPHADLDPRYLAFEYNFGVVLWKRQLELSEGLLAKETDGQSAVVQLLMGQGKSAVVSPLMALPLTERLLQRGEGGVLVFCCPKPLVRQALAVLGGRFTAMTDKTPLLFECDRGRGDIDLLARKVRTAAKFGNILISSPESLKSCLLRTIESLSSSESGLPPGHVLEHTVMIRNCGSEKVSECLVVYGTDGMMSPRPSYNGSDRFALRRCGKGYMLVNEASTPPVVLAVEHVRGTSDVDVKAVPMDEGDLRQVWGIIGAGEGSEEMVIWSLAEFQEQGSAQRLLTKGGSGQKLIVSLQARGGDALRQRWVFEAMKQRVTTAVLTPKVGYAFISCLSWEPVRVPWGHIHQDACLSCRWGALESQSEQLVVRPQAGGAFSLHWRAEPTLALSLNVPGKKCEDGIDVEDRTVQWRDVDPSDERQHWFVVATRGSTTKVQFHCKAKQQGATVALTCPPDYTPGSTSFMEAQPVDGSHDKHNFLVEPKAQDATVFTPGALVQLRVLHADRSHKGWGLSGVGEGPGPVVFRSECDNGWKLSEGQWHAQPCEGLPGWYSFHRAQYTRSKTFVPTTDVLTATPEGAVLLEKRAEAADEEVAKRQRWQRVMTSEGFILTCQAFPGTGGEKLCISCLPLTKQGPEFVIRKVLVCGLKSGASLTSVDVTESFHTLIKDGKIKKDLHRDWQTFFGIKKGKIPEGKLECCLETSVGKIMFGEYAGFCLVQKNKRWVVTYGEIMFHNAERGWETHKDVYPLRVGMAPYKAGTGGQVFAAATVTLEARLPAPMAAPLPRGATVGLTCKSIQGLDSAWHFNGTHPGSTLNCANAGKPIPLFIVGCGLEGVTFMSTQSPALDVMAPAADQAKRVQLMNRDSKYRHDPNEEWHTEWLVEASPVRDIMGNAYCTITAAANPSLAWTHEGGGNFVSLQKLKPQAPDDTQLWSLLDFELPRAVGNAMHAREKEVNFGEEVSGGASQNVENLATIVKHFKAGVILVDEVDSIMAPMTSELNFPVGREDLVPLGRKRWRFAMRTIERCLPLLKEGLGSKSVQNSPHLALVDEGWYMKHLVPKVAVEVRDILLGEAPALAAHKDAVVMFLGSAVSPIPPEMTKLEDEDKQMLCLGRQWVFNMFPHCSSKVSRVNYGLAKDAKRLVSVPFLAKDVPSERSEFAHPDIVIGLGYLSYHYEGLRITDVKNILELLVRDVGLEKGPPVNRPTYALFESFLGEFDTSNRPVPPIHMVNLDHAPTIAKVHKEIARSEKAVMFYLDSMVFPQTLKFATRKLTACGQELGNSIMFKRCLGFTGTSDDLVPSKIEPEHAIADTTAMIQTLSHPVVSSAVELPQGWSADTILDIVATKKFDALIDAGGLITAYPNDVVASILLFAGPSKDVYHLSHKDVAVFLDAQTDNPLFISRTQKQPRPLSECTTPLHRRFVFFDQVHCTGTDVKQANDANAALLMGKDMTFRDLAQAAWRMRKLGPSGQHLVMHVPPELYLLAKQHVARIPSGSGWEPTLLNVVLTHCVRHGAARVKMNEQKLVEQEATAGLRREAVEKLTQGESTDGAFEEDVDHSVQMAPLEGALDSEVVQQQQQEEQKEQQKVLQRVAQQAVLAEHRVYDLAALSAGDEAHTNPLRGVIVMNSSGEGAPSALAGNNVKSKDKKKASPVQTIDFGDLQSTGPLVTMNFLRVGGESANEKTFADRVVPFLRNVFAVLQLADGKTFVAVCLDEADAIRRHLTFSKSAPKNLVLWTRKGVVLASSAVAPPPPTASLSTFRFFNGDLWYTEDEVASLARAFGVTDGASDAGARLRALLLSLANSRRREKVNVNSSSLAGIVIKDT